MSQQLGVIGLGVMGANLARNAARNGASVSVFNRTSEKTDAFMKKYKNEGSFTAHHALKDFVESLKSPRPILFMVKADAVDEMIDQLQPYITKGDILIDAGNSHFHDTERRQEQLQKKGISFIGMGVSGGEEGALKGPSMMPGGDEEVLEHIMPLLRSMAADDTAGGKCITLIGAGGSGHFVKMVHNGIEYGIMQLLAEAYAVLKSLGGFSHAQLADIFDSWNNIPALDSFLVEISAKIFRMKDPSTGKDLLDVIKDGAGQKGTGKWTVEAAWELGMTIPTIDAAVSARILSGDSKRSIRKREKFPVELDEENLASAQELPDLVRDALECSIICTYNQGFHLLERASGAYGWNINIAEVSRIWRGGCIIRSAILESFQRARNPNPNVEAFEVEGIVGRFGGGRQVHWRKAVADAISRGVSVPALSASLSYYDTLRADRLPQTLIQAQRDFFGAHGFERIDKEGVFHGEWKKE